MGEAQKKVSEDTSIKTSMEDDTKSDPERNKEITTETDKRPDKEKQLDWKDDEDGAEGLKSKLLDDKVEDKRDGAVDVMTVAKATVTKVIEDAKQKVAEKSSERTSPIEDDSDKEKKDVAPEKDEASRESIPDWRDDKDGAKGLKSKLVHDKSEQESREENKAKSDATKLEKDAKQQNANDKEDNIVAKDDEAITDTIKEVEGENAAQTSSKEAALNWRDEKGGVKGLKATLLEGKAEEKDAIGNEALINAAKETVTKVIKDAKQKVSEEESSRTESTEGKIEIDIK